MARESRSVAIRKRRGSTDHLTRGPSYHDLDRGMPTDDDLAHLRELVFDSGDDRAAALVAGAMIDNLLAWCLLLSFRLGIDPDFSENLLYGDSGALNNMSAKIKVLYAFGFIEDNLRRELETIRGIRNIFAHSPQRLSFDNETVATRIADLKIAVGDEEAGAMAVGGGRFSFLAAVNVCMRLLIRTAMTFEKPRATHGC